MYDSKPNWQGVAIPGLEGFKAQKGIGECGTQQWTPPTGDTVSLESQGEQSLMQSLLSNKLIWALGIMLAISLFTGEESGPDEEDVPVRRRRR